MADQTKILTPELRLVLLCARVATSEQEEGSIRSLLEAGIDWTVFARQAVGHGLAGLCGHTLARVAPDLVPGDILDALRVLVEQTRRSNTVLFDELVRLIDALAKAGIGVIPFKGPVLALQAYGDLGFRVFRDLDFLIRDGELGAAIAALHGLGYERQGQLTDAQFELIHRLQGQEILFRNGAGTALEPHTRLTAIKMALDIDYAGLWRRAQRSDLNGASLLTLAPEDALLVLAIHGGKEMWWNIKWACDVAAFIASHPRLDWKAIDERARAQGCLRMVLLATALAQRYFAAGISPAILAAQGADPMIEAMVGRILAHWQSGEPGGPPSNKTLSLDRLRLHDGLARRARYVARTLLLPGPQHVAMMPLPQKLGFTYVPLAIAHDLIALPLWRVWKMATEQAERVRDAIAGSDLALNMLPAPADAKLSRQRHLKKREEATRVLAADPNNGSAWLQLGHALLGLKHYREAINAYDKALAFEPDNSIIWKNRDAALRAIGRKEDLAGPGLNPPDADGWTVRAGAFWYLNRYAETVEASDRALGLDPEHVAAQRIGIHSRLQSCDWSRREDDKRQVSAGLKTGAFVIRTIDHRALCDSEEELRLTARLVARQIPVSTKPLWRGERYDHDKIRIAYLSSDLRTHAVASLIAGCFEHHDKMRFETTAISLHRDDGSNMRRRIVAAFDRFIDAQDMNDTRVATMLRDLEIDIAIDLNGYTGYMRSGILARRPAPVQVNYLGYPGTMDASYIDYVIADRVVIPDENRIHYSERVVSLPQTYFPTDDQRLIANKIPSRAEAGLPEIGFVFACFNHTYKIAPEIFDVWMRLLQTVEGSVLWLRTTNTAAMSNLWREAKARGVAPGRLIFAPVVPKEEDHLVRLRLADLFLDTRPYNAHATACDALWAGLPVVTCPGNSFPARVAASLLHAVGLPELVASSLTEYEELARSLAQDPGRLAAVKAKLARNRGTETLFDTARFTRNLEIAFTMMWEKQQAGRSPESFSVDSAQHSANTRIA